MQRALKIQHWFFRPKRHAERNLEPGVPQMDLSDRHESATSKSPLEFKSKIPGISPRPQPKQSMVSPKPTAFRRPAKSPISHQGNLTTKSQDISPSQIPGAKKGTFCIKPTTVNHFTGRPLKSPIHGRQACEKSPAVARDPSRTSVKAQPTVGLTYEEKVADLSCDQIIGVSKEDLMAAYDCMQQKQRRTRESRK
jgi:hypothetical protein